MNVYGVKKSHEFFIRFFLYLWQLESNFFFDNLFLSSSNVELIFIFLHSPSDFAIAIELEYFNSVRFYILFSQLQISTTLLPLLQILDLRLLTDDFPS